MRDLWRLCEDFTVETISKLISGFLGIVSAQNVGMVEFNILGGLIYVWFNPPDYLLINNLFKFKQNSPYIQPNVKSRGLQLIYYFFYNLISEITYNYNSLISFLK